MSAWDRIEEAVLSAPVEIRVSPAEALAAREAQRGWAEGIISEASAWAALELVIEADIGGPLTKAVKGLVPHEAQLVKHMSPGAQSKAGMSGEVMALSPKEWLRIKQEIESQPDYYDRILGGASTAREMSKKIGDQISLAMGSVPASQPKLQALPGPEPAPKPQADIDRRRRVAAQDRAMMGGKTKPIGKVSVK